MVCREAHKHDEHVMWNKAYKKQSYAGPCLETRILYSKQVIIVPCSITTLNKMSSVTLSYRSSL